MKFSLLLLFAISSTAFARGPAGTFRDVYGPRFHRQPATFLQQKSKAASDVLHHWNRIAIDATGLDHTPVAPGENRVFGEQLGPGRSSRAMAIVHIAIFDAINAILGGYHSYTGIESAPHPVSTRAAVAQAAHDTLVSLYPSQKALLTRNWRTTFCASERQAEKQRGGIGPTDCRCDPGFARWRWLGNTGASSGRRLFHKRPSGTLAAGPNQPDSSRARRALGRMQTIRDKVNDPIRGTAAACSYQRKVYHGL